MAPWTGPTQTPWLFQLTANAALLAVILWRPAPRLFRVYVAFAFVTGIGLFLLNHHGLPSNDNPFYNPVRLALKALLLIGQALMVREVLRGRNLRIPLEWTTLAVLAIAVFLHRPEVWSDSMVEMCEWLLATGSLWLGFVLISVGLEGISVLAAFVLLDAITLYPASAFSHTIQRAQSIASALCYVAWIVVFAAKRGS
jgi:hypothetical protein